MGPQSNPSISLWISRLSSSVIEDMETLGLGERWVYLGSNGHLRGDVAEEAEKLGYGFNRF